MRSPERIMELAALGTAQALAAQRCREADQWQRMLAAVRTLIDARADLAKAGYALVSLEPTGAGMNQANNSWRSLVRPETVLDAAEKLSRPEFIEWIAGIFDLIDLDARAALFIAMNSPPPSKPP